MPAHIHFKEIALYAKDAAESNKPWVRWQEGLRDGRWGQCTPMLDFDANKRYRRLLGKPFSAEEYRLGMRVIDKDGNICYPIRSLYKDPNANGDYVVEVVYKKGWAHPKLARLHASSLFFDWNNYDSEI